MNIYNAARAAGYSEGYSRNAKAERVAKISMADAFEQAGITDKFLVKYAKEGLEAMKLYGKDSEEFADWATRHRFFETILKLTDKLRDKVVHEITVKLAEELNLSRNRLESYAREN